MNDARVNSAVQSTMPLRAWSDKNTDGLGSSEEGQSYGS